MLDEPLNDVPEGEAGVYCLYDLDGEPAYVGRTSNLRSRLRQHFIRQDSSVVSYGRLDIWDISRFEWWQTEKTKQAEDRLIFEQGPYLNFAETPSPTSVDGFDPTAPHGTVPLMSDDDLRFRTQPYNRAQQKLNHLSRMLDKIKLAGHSDETKQTLYIHEQILRENMEAFLGVERENGK